MTDTQIIAVTLTTLKHWVPLIGVDAAAEVAAQRMARLHANRSAS
jgi:hypothetical protein